MPKAPATAPVAWEKIDDSDGIGVYRNMENGFPVDSSGALAGTDVDGPFVGVVELGERLASSEMVRNCFAQNWFQFAMARGALATDRCTLDTAFAKFLKSDGTIRDLFIDIVRADEFVRRLPQRK